MNKDFNIYCPAMDFGLNKVKNNYYLDECLERHELISKMKLLNDDYKCIKCKFGILYYLINCENKKLKIIIDYKFQIQELIEKIFKDKIKNQQRRLKKIHLKRIETIKENSKITKCLICKKEFIKKHKNHKFCTFVGPGNCRNKYRSLNGEFRK